MTELEQVVTHRSSRGRRIGQVLLVLLALLILATVWKHWRDRLAWPLQLTEVRLDPLPIPEPDGIGFWEIMQELAPGGTNDTETGLSPEELRELQKLEALGLAAAPDWPLLESRLNAEAPAFEVWAAAATAPLEPVAIHNIREWMPVLLRVVEIARLTIYPVAQTIAEEEWELVLDLWHKSLQVAQKVSASQGAVGHFIALNVELGICREILLATAEREIPPGIARQLDDMLREAALALPPLAEALRRDRQMAHRALTAVSYSRRTIPAEGTEPGQRHPPGYVLWLSRRFGSNPIASSNHLDAVASHVIAAAERPYDHRGLLAELPAWCRFESRPPWTRDPLGALVTTVFLRNVAAAAAYPAHRQTELQAARLALAIGQARQHSPEQAWPDSLPPLLDGSAVPADPFDPAAAPFRYRLQDDGWRFYSIGMNQQDNGGTNDLLSAAADKVKSADLIYSSDERQKRRIQWEAANANQPPQPGDS